MRSFGIGLAATLDAHAEEAIPQRGEDLPAHDEGQGQEWTLVARLDQWGKTMNQAVAILAAGTLTFAACEVGGQQKGAEPAPQTHQLKAAPKTVAWGYYDANAKPVLRIRSGDTVEVQTLITNSPEGLEKALLPSGQVEQALRDIFKDVTDKGPGGHILTGPIYVDGAEPGDTLEVRIQKIKLALP